MQYQVSFTQHHDYAYCWKLDCASNTNPISSQATKLCVVSGFLLVKVCALPHHLEVCTSSGSA